MRKVILSVLLFSILVAGILFGLLGTVKEEPRPLSAPCAPPIEKSTPELLENHPVLEGGIHSLEHLKSLVQTKMYEGVDLDSLHEVIAQRDYWAFVQYKRGSRIFWTHRLVLIKKGETLYVDRNGRTIRAICGNEISPTPQSPTLEIEPIDNSIDGETTENLPFELPNNPIVPPLISDITNPIQPVGIATPIIPYTPIFCCGGVLVQPMSAQPVPTPEPGYGWLLIIIVFAILFVSRKNSLDNKN